ncbi:MAG: phenylalanine--tRNA ligase subunit beta [Rickettsiales bacterium]|jgi:phenylalanyl-tRNA synthetase beta chain|nr:phenylalanine--tRNA ligase subunit beta [Rickettsiales bacterium]
MKWTYGWLRDYLDTDASPQEIADMLTLIGLEVESVEMLPVPVAAKIVECSDVPDTHLRKLLVDDGSGILRQVVCGAPNAREGLVSALAVPGCKIGDMEIKSGKIRGILSDGMMCSEKELGISDNHDGIMELLENSEIGTPVSSRSEFVFEAGITPNRPDYLAVCGIARDLSATVLGKYIEKKEIQDLPKSGELKVIIKNPVACPIYRLCKIRGIKNGPSNPTIASRLSAIGVNPRNAPIDATNYICYDLGQPMHCFDADEIKGDIIVRNAENGEKFTDLFGTEHELWDSDLVIADSAGILALAGIIGGQRGMTADRTENILLESAYFDPVTIRRTSKRIGVSTDASYRYERGIDPTTTGPALARAVKIINDACGGDVVGTAVGGKDSAAEIKITYNPDLFLKKTGIAIPTGKQKEILRRLGFDVQTDSGEWTIVPTPARVDVVIPENIVSELIRIYGYENIKSEEKISAPKPVLIPGLKSTLANHGLNEIVNYEFGDSAKEELLSIRPQVHVLNPIIDTFDTVRNSMVQGMLDVIANNDRFKRSNLALFELGPVFDGNQPGQHHNQLIIARAGLFSGKIGIKHGRESDIYDVREDLLALFPGAMAENDANPPLWAHPFLCGHIVQNGATVAQFAELHPNVAKKFGIKTKVVLGLVENADMIKVPGKNAESQVMGIESKMSLAEFPLITRDFAFVVSDGTAPEAIVEAAKSADSRIVETNVFDVFDLGCARKSVAFEIVIQPESNMTDCELLELQNTVIAAVEKGCPAKIRDK